MAVEYTCDGCGKKQMADKMPHGWFKPRNWYQRMDEDGPQDACSRKCIKTIAEKTNKTSIVLPI